MLTIEFWKSAGETAIKAAAAAALGAIGSSELITAVSVDWTQVGGIALLAGIVSILTSIVVPSPETRAAKREAARVEAEAAAVAATKAAVRKSAAKATKKA